MSKLLAVAARELRERWILFPAGLVIGFLPFVVQAFGVEREHAPVVGLVQALLYGLAAAVVIGSTMLARDAASGRLGFLFSRPVSWPAIWGGKWLAAVVLVVACGLLAAIPSTTAYPPERAGSWLEKVGPEGSVFLLLLVPIGIGFANFNATAFRSRSPWLALDLTLLLLAFWAIRKVVAPLFMFSLMGLKGAWGQLLLLSPLAVGLVLASAFQVARGRTDIRRAHRAMSIAFWSTIALTLAVAGGYLLWVLGAGPADLRGGLFGYGYSVTPDPAGRWIYVEGRSSRGGGHYYPGLLLDTATGRYVGPDRSWLDARAPWTAGRDVSFSADGRSAARWVAGADGRATQIEVLELAAPSPRSVAFALESSPPPTWKTSVALSPSGGFALLVHESGASLFAIPSGKRVATATLPPGWEVGVVPAVSETGARLWLVPAGDARGRERAAPAVRVLDIAVDGTTRLATFERSAPPEGSPGWPDLPGHRAGEGRLVPLAEGRRLLTFDGGVRLRDGATGALLATLAEGPRQGLVAVLTDGRIVLVDPDGTRMALRSFDPEGRPLLQVTVEASPQGLSGGREVAPGRVALGVGPPFAAGETLIVEVDTGRIVDRLAGVRPARGSWWSWRVGPVDVSPPGAVRTAHYFADGDGRLVRIDFATGERKVVAGPGAPPGERIRVR